MHPTARALLLAGVLALGGCIQLVPTESSAPGIAFPPPPTEGHGSNAKDAGDLHVVWPDPAPSGYAALQDALRKDGQFEAWIGALNSRLALPHDIHLRYDACGMENAYYDPEKHEVVLCYELLDHIATTMNDPSRNASENALATGSAWLFVVIHELGHALIDAYGLPIVGREEDAADNLATLTLIHANASDAAVDAAAFWAGTDPGGYSNAQFADEHSLNAQRFYDILCIVYGSDPGRYRWLADEGYLPDARAQRCETEYQRLDASYEKLLAPWQQS